MSGVSVINDGSAPRIVQVSTDTSTTFDAIIGIDTPGEADYYRHGGILQYVVRKMLAS